MVLSAKAACCRLGCFPVQRCREVFEQADNLDDTSLRLHWCFTHAQAIWCNHSEHKALLRDKENLELIKGSLSWANRSIFTADAAPIAIDLMLKMWSEEYDEWKFAKRWASHWLGKPILRCQALNGFPSCLPPHNNMLEVCCSLAMSQVPGFASDKLMCRQRTASSRGRWSAISLPLCS
jgi:hypothetical protein